MNNPRPAVALVIGLVICVLAITPFAWAIKHFDLGVGLLLVAPVLVWVLLRVGQRLERWSRNEPDVPPVDPDYPDDNL
jgi:multisubunit Na+/H+ antiporter MnhG subunit